MDNVLELRNINKTYKEFSLRNLSFSLQRGYIMGFIGPNGAGKSTTIKLIMNLIRKDSGDIKVFGKDHIRDEKEIKEKIGFVYDENHFYEELTLEKMKKVIAPFYRDWDENVFQQYIKRFNLPIGLKIKELSKGMRMKYSLTLALSHHAELIIMDEPTSGLDPMVRGELLDVLHEIIQDERKSVIFSTHITTDLDKIADYVTFINNGSLVFSQSKDEILESYVMIKGDKNILGDELRKKLIGVKEYGFGFEALTHKSPDIKDILRDTVIYERPTLEDIMVYTVRGGRNA